MTGYAIRGGVGFRIFAGETMGLQILSVVSGFSMRGHAQLVYDDGTEDEIVFNRTALLVANTGIGGDHPAIRAGWVVGIWAQPLPQTSAPSPGGIYVQALINRNADLSPANVTEIVASGYVGGSVALMLGYTQPKDYLATWVFQGTVAEDATGGTHVCALTITPGAGQELIVEYGMIIDGATATAQTANASIDDGTNELTDLVNPYELSSTVTSGIYAFPFNMNVSTANLALGVDGIANAGGFHLSGTMRLILSVTTAAISVTQTFSVVCRLKGALPTATLSDSVGTPTLTTNTSQVF